MFIVDISSKFRGPTKRCTLDPFCKDCEFIKDAHYCLLSLFKYKTICHFNNLQQRKMINNQL